MIEDLAVLFGMMIFNLLMVSAVRIPLFAVLFGFTTLPLTLKIWIPQFSPWINLLSILVAVLSILWGASKAVRG